MNLLAMHREATARDMRLTVLHRPNGTWSKLELGRLVNGLTTEACSHPKHPEDIIVYGHYSKDEVLGAILGGQVFTVKQVTGIENPELPFRPSFM